jgi:hypothetical protein
MHTRIDSIEDRTSMRARQFIVERSIIRMGCFEFHGLQLDSDGKREVGGR